MVDRVDTQVLRKVVERTRMIYILFCYIYFRMETTQQTKNQKQTNKLISTENTSRNRGKKKDYETISIINTRTKINEKQEIKYRKRKVHKPFTTHKIERKTNKSKNKNMRMKRKNAKLTIVRTILNTTSRHTLGIKLLGN